MSTLTTFSFYTTSHYAPKYQPQRNAARDTRNMDEGGKKFLLDMQSGSIVKEVSTEFEFSAKRKFAFGAEFVSSEDEKKIRSRQ